MSENNQTGVTAFKRAVHAVNEALKDNHGRATKAEIIRDLKLDTATNTLIRNHFGLEHY